MNPRTLVCSVVLVLAPLAGCVREGFHPATPAAPIQDYTFKAEPSEIAAGETIKLQWNIPGATKVSIDASAKGLELPHVGTFTGSGELEQHPEQDTTYVITCEGSKSVSCASVSVKVRVKQP